MKTHPFADSGHEEPYCLTCGLPKSNRRHDLPPTDPAAAATEARRYPDHEEKP